MNVKAINPHHPLREGAQPADLLPKKTLLDMLYYMKLTRELEFRIERKLYRQGKIVGGVYVGRGQEAIAVGSLHRSSRQTTWSARRTATWARS